MEFKTRIGSTFIMNMSFVALALVMAIFSFFYTGYNSDFFRFSCVLWLIIAYVRFRAYRKYIYLILYNKPVLIVNESYMYDLVNKMKYYWKDIDTVYENNAYLYVKLYKPDDNLNESVDPVENSDAGVISDTNGTSFVINMDLVNVDSNVFSEIIDEYRHQTTKIESSPNGNNFITYYLKLGRNFYMSLFLLLLSFYWIIKDIVSHDYISISIFGLLGLIICWRLIIIIYIGLFKKPMLTANESYIFDHYKNIKYYWEDIKEVIASDRFLDMQLYEPEKYFIKVKNPFLRLIIKINYKIFKVKSPYTIDLDFLDIKKGENKKFLDTLNDYSIKAL